MSLQDRQRCRELVREAEQAGAGRAASCQLLELSLRTLERWEKDPEQGDRRSGPKTPPAHSLTEEEKRQIVTISNEAAYRDLSPWQIVAKLADSGRYLASESSFYRVLKQQGLLAHRSKSRPRRQQPPRELVARHPNEVWSWDITYLKGPVVGTHFYLYLVEDVFSRMIVGWCVEEVESGEHAARLMARICDEQQVTPGRLTLHSDNGGSMKGATMLSTLQRLGVVPSFSRPSVSDDNPFSESLFKTLKYRPSYPDGAFAGIEEAREWVERFTRWYNREHLHSGIRFVTPQSRHEGLDHELLNKRKIVYEAARVCNPLRWSRSTRNWSRIEEVRLNPRKGNQKELRNQAA